MPARGEPIASGVPIGVPGARLAPSLSLASGARIRTTEVDLSVDLAPRRPGSLKLSIPLLVASGVAGYGIELADAIDVGRLGAICTRGTTRTARPGNPPPRMTEVPGGLLNAVGLQNPGIETVLAHFASRWAGWSVPVIVNLCADSADGFADLARRLDGQAGVAGLELNLSCPDATRAASPFAFDREAAARVVAAVRAETDLPLLAKLSPGATDVRAVARAVEDAGADAICAVNTLTGLAIDREARRPLLGTAYGGISGPALKPVALRVVYEVAQVVRIPIVGIGGVGSLADVLDFLLAGASAVGVGTAALADPELPARLGDELATWCASQGLASGRGLVGAARPRRRDRPITRAAEYRL